MLILQSIGKRYSSGVMAVQNVSLTLEKGVVGLLGPNGAGKTTLIQMIATITKPTNGSITLHGVDIIKKPDFMRERLGFLPQDFGVYDNLSALELLRYFGALKGIRNEKKLMELLEVVNLHHVAHQTASTFSGGMRQRLGIAQALMNNPEILIVDEPTAGLDPEERIRLRNVLSEIGGATLVILSTHIVSDIEAIATHIAIMNHGILLCYATPESLMQQQDSLVWQAVISSEQFERLRSELHISTAVRKPNGVHVRIISKEQPLPEANKAEPTLEDAFLSALHHTRQSTEVQP